MLVQGLFYLFFLIAAKHNHREVLANLIANKANLDKKDKHGSTALMNGNGLAWYIYYSKN